MVSFAAVYVNRDQRTGFGTPWEIRFQANYTVLRKGGNVPGHSSIMSFVPELQLGMLQTYSTVAALMHNWFGIYICKTVVMLKSKWLLNYSCDSI